MSGGVDEQRVIGEQSTVETVLDQEQATATQEFSAQKGDSSQLSMQVKVYSPFRDYYNEQAFSISAENATGPFDILPQHHNFISLLLPCELVIRTINDSDQRIRISGGIMHVKADQVIVFLDV